MINSRVHAIFQVEDSYFFMCCLLDQVLSKMAGVVAMASVIEDFDIQVRL